MAAGEGGASGAGNQVTVTNTGTIATQGAQAIGVLAKSIGGGGGAGGFAAGAALTTSGGATNNAVGGAGGAAGVGGQVTVNNWRA